MSWWSLTTLANVHAVDEVAQVRNQAVCDGQRVAAQGSCRRPPAVVVELEQESRVCARVVSLVLEESEPRTRELQAERGAVVQYVARREARLLVGGIVV